MANRRIPAREKSPTIMRKSLNSNKKRVDKRSKKMRMHISKVMPIMERICGNRHVKLAGSFCMCYIVEKIAEDLVKFAVQALEINNDYGDKTILPKHVIQGIHMTDDFRDAMEGVLSDFDYFQNMISSNFEFNGMDPLSLKSILKKRDNSRSKSHSAKISFRSLSNKKSPKNVFTNNKEKLAKDIPKRSRSIVKGKRDRSNSSDSTN